jgi:hypothetical protein
MIRSIIVLVILGVVMVAGCASEAQASVDPPEVQWAKEITIKCAEQAIGYKVLPNMDDHLLTTEPAGTIGKDIRDFRVKGVVYRAYDGRGYDVSATFRVQESDQDLDVEMRLMSVDGRSVKIPEMMAQF